MKIDAKRIWLISDTHFGVRSNSREWMNVIEEFFTQQLIPLLKKEAKPGDILVHCGDTFDSRQSINLYVMNKAIDIMEEITHIMPVYTIIGNHDIFMKYSNEINSMKIFKHLKNFTVLENPTMLETHEGKKLFFLPWVDDHAELSEIAKDPKNSADVMFCHADVKGLSFNRYVKVDHGAEVDTFTGFHRVYSGHIHYSQTFGKMRMLGSPFQLTRSDTDNAKGITVLDLESGDEEYYENNYSPKFVRITFDKVLNSTPNELNPIFKNNFIDILVDPELAVKAPLGLLTEYVIPPLKISFTPINNPGEELVDEGFHDLEGKSFSILDLTKLYLDKCNYEDDKKTKIYKAIEKLLHKISVQVKEDEEQED